MCGKFTQMYTWQEAHAFSQPLIVEPEPDAAAVVIATPMRFAKIMRLGAQGERELVDMRWGFAGKDDAAPAKPRHMHARSETVDSLPTFAQAFAGARGICMVHTFNEGEELESGKTKQWIITPNDRQPIAIAVICEEWRNGPEALLTFVMVTTPPNALISRITDRMPAILPREAWPLWLGEHDASPADVKALLKTYEDGGNWIMTEQASGKPPRLLKPPKPDSQYELF